MATLGRDDARQSEGMRTVNMSAYCERIHGTAVKKPGSMKLLKDGGNTPLIGWAWGWSRVVSSIVHWKIEKWILPIRSSYLERWGMTSIEPHIRQTSSLPNIRNVPSNKMAGVRLFLSLSVTILSFTVLVSDIRMVTAFVTTLSLPPKYHFTLSATPEEATTTDSFRKGDFVNAISQKTGLSKKESEAALKAVLDVIVEQVQLDKKIKLPGFGTFSSKVRAARKGRNPQTGEEIQIASSKTPSFTPTKSWKDVLNGKVSSAKDAEEDE
jgi:DNA-binding protein HU-beta